LKQMERDKRKWLRKKYEAKTESNNTLLKKISEVSTDWVPEKSESIQEMQNRRENQS